MFDDDSQLKEYEVGEFVFKKFSSFCPEQWHIYRDNEIIGYIRTRWGDVRVDYYKTGYEDYKQDFSWDKVDVIVDKNSEGFGTFDTDEERITLFNQVAMILSEKLELPIPIVPKVQEEFENWFNEFGGFSFRSERFWGDIESGDKVQIKNWIETAFQMGYLSGIKK